jgi:alkylation response protein AidB-like acyl-CoA dehydrogenase
MPIAAPPAETAWLLHHVLGVGAMDQADIEAILEQSTRTAEGSLAPLDAIGDRTGAKLRDGRVTLPPGFAEALRAYADAGWIGIAADPAHGGQGLPDVIALAAFEPVSSANMAFGLCPMLTQDAIKVLAAHGTPDQQQRLMRPMIAGKWTGTMCLTEPQSGSDLGGVRTRAEPAGAEPDAGGYRITGQKIYITYGEHDAADNILHLVLARLPDALPGSAGISLFAVPKFLPDGTRNPVTCLSLEHKLGIHASPTCVMGFAGAQGELIGAPGRGLPAMFAMMNAARLGVAMQGVAVAERAFRRANAFAAQRPQGGAMIDQHPDVRRMLLTMRALALAGRLLTLHAASIAGPRAELLITVAKAWCTDAGVEAASLGVQVHGGMGFIEETGAAQHLRDARITPIYEGTNGIQALTLLKRGLLRDQGQAVRALLDDIADTPALAPFAGATAEAAAWLRHAEPRAAEAGATAFLAAIGTLTAGWLCARVLAHPEAPPAAARAAQVFLDQVLPRVDAATATILRPSAAIMDQEDIQ